MTEQEIAALKEGSAFLYRTLNNVALLHSNVTFEDSETKEEIDACEHCTALVSGEVEDTVVRYPCPTMRLILNDFEIAENPSES